MENKNIIKALAEFQKLCPPIKKDSKADVKTKAGGSYSYKYGSLPHILEIIKPLLEKTGLTYTQLLSIESGQRCIITNLYHIETCELLQSVVDIPEVEFAGMNIYQSMGSGITYLRRYALMAILGIVAEEDDNDAQGEQVKKKAGEKPIKDNRPNLKPELYNKPDKRWAEAVKYLVGGGSITDIEKKYRLTEEHTKQLIEETKKAE
ncbi:MAG TPA: hypothetical protein ENH82_15115 [bacterium]|nr:hypothetical protein [bacterium]